jgi:hypothetical protein
MAFFGTEAKLELLSCPSRPHRNPPPSLRWRDMDWHDLANIDLLCRQRVADAVGDESTQTFLIEMLELAAATQGKMLAGRCRVMRAVDQAARRIDHIPRRGVCNVSAIGGYAIATCGDPDNLF